MNDLVLRRNARITELAVKLSNLELSYNSWASENTPSDPILRAESRVRGELLIAEINQVKYDLRQEQAPMY